MQGARWARGLRLRAEGFFRPARVLALGFLAVIAIGTLLLMTPAAAAGARSVPFMDALFTATSATCVTGLTVVPTGNTFTLFGQMVILLLIQVGGLGFMLFVTLTMVALGRRITLHSRILLRETMSMQKLSGSVRNTMRFGLTALLVEFAGAVLLAFRFVPQKGFWPGVWQSAFHSVSAFCNAGFDILGGGDSLTACAQDGYLLIVLSLLIILGGLGFAVLSDCVANRFRFRALSLHTKIVLCATGALLAAGFAFYLLVEGGNAETLGAQGAGTRALGAWFQSVTLRTAGFDAMNQGSMTDASKAFSCILMLIGASPASTGGGVKTSTVTVVVLIVLNVLRGRADNNAFKRRLPTDIARSALTVLTLFLLLAITGSLALSLTEQGSGIPFIDLAFEASSALSTCGLSTISTASLSAPGHSLLILLMYIGRVGPMTMMFTFLQRKGATDAIRYPEEQIIIG